MNDPLLSTLEAVGLSDKESRVFVALVGMGEATAGDVAKKSGLKRSIVYFTLERLITQGLCQEIVGHKVKRYEAVPAARLYQHVQANVENLRLILPLLRAMQHGGGEKPRVELVEGKEAILPVYRSMEHAKESRYFTSWNNLKTAFPEEVRRWAVHAADVKNPNEVKNLIVDDVAGREMARAMRSNPKQQFKLFPKNEKFSMNFGIADTTVAITNFEPLFCVVIHSQAVADCLRIVFDLAWTSARTIRK
jgi:sugar-specific transcriptional regulator TrmB